MEVYHSAIILFHVMYQSHYCMTLYFVITYKHSYSSILFALQKVILSITHQYAVLHTTFIILYTHNNYKNINNMNIILQR